MKCWLLSTDSLYLKQDMWRTTKYAGQKYFMIFVILPSIYIKRVESQCNQILGIALNLAYILRCACQLNLESDVKTTTTTTTTTKTKQSNGVHANHNTLMGHEFFSRGRQCTTQLKLMLVKNHLWVQKQLLTLNNKLHLPHTCALSALTCQCWAPFSSAICMVFVCVCVPAQHIQSHL